MRTENPRSELSPRARVALYGLMCVLAIPFVAFDLTWARGSGNRFYVDADLNF